MSYLFPNTKQFIQDIQTVQTEGPYCLGAHCGDFILVLEMAQQFQSQGQKMALLVCFDGIMNMVKEHGNHYSIRMHWRNFLENGPSYLLYKIRRRFQLFFMLLKKLHIIFRQKKGKALSNEMKNILFIEAFRSALYHHVPQYYAGNITLFLTKESRLMYLPEAARLVADRVNIYDVAGYHDNLYVMPQLETLGKQLKHCLDKTAKLYDDKNLVSLNTDRAVLEESRQKQQDLPWTSLVPIQANGSKPPLFCVPPAGNTALSFVNLARHLGMDQPVYGLQPLGFEEGQVPHNRVEDMAAYYIKEIRSFQPEGPYYLGGTCFGAFVAFEMAQQLLAQGCTVALLALFDPGTPSYSAVPIQHRNAFEKIGHYIRQTAYHFKRGQLIHALMDFFVYRRYRWLKMKFLPQDYRIKCVMDAHQAARMNYIPQIYPGKITLFRSSEVHALEKKGFWAKRWSDLASGGFDCHVIEGKHREILGEPRIQELAKQLKLCLDEAQQTTQS